MSVSIRRSRARHLSSASLGVLALVLSMPQMARAADTVISTSVGPQTWTEDNFTIAPSGTVTGGASSGVQVDHPDSGGTFINQGTLSYSNLTGIHNGSAPSGSDIAPTSFIELLRNEGTIVSTDSNYVLGIFNGSDGYIGTIDNRGDINAQFIGIANYASIGTLRNSGTISGSGAGGYQQTDGDWAHTNLIDNSGTISGQIYAIGIIGSVDTIINRAGGTITSPQYGMILAGDVGSIDNQGTIFGQRLGGIQFSGSRPLDFGTVTNSGSIGSSNLAIYVGSDSTVAAIDNSGTISGGQNGIINEGTISELNNSGTISIPVDQIVETGWWGTSTDFFYAINNSGSLGAVTNSGLIAGNILNMSANDLTINGGVTTRGTLSGAQGGIGMIDNQDADIHFNSGMLLLNDNINVFPSAVFAFLGASHAVRFAGANVQVNNEINVTGNMVLSAGELVFGVNSPTTYGHIVVAGDADLNAGNVSLVALGASSFAVGQRYHVLTADQLSVSSSVTTSIKGFVTSWSSEAAGGAGDFVVAIDGIDQSYNRLSLTAQQVALNSVSPVIDAVASHKPDGIASLGSGMAAGSSAASSALWGKVLVAGSSLDTSAGTAGYDGHSSGVIVGYDMPVSDSINAGLALSWLRSSGDADDQIDGTDVDLDTYALTAYGAWAATDRWQFSGQLSYGLNRYDQRRGVSAISAVATSDYDGDQITGELRGGYTLPLSAATSLTPYAALRGAYISLDSYTEEGAGAFNLAVNSSSGSAIRHDIGVTLATSFDTGDGKLTPALSVGWLHDYKDTPLSVSGISGGAGFVSTSDRMAQDGLSVGFTADLAANDSVTVGVEYAGEFRSDYQSHTGALKLAVRF